jgi:hypothetical protein
LAREAANLAVKSSFVSGGSSFTSCKGKETSMLLSTQLLGLLNKYPDIDSALAMAKVSGAASGHTASVSAKVAASTDGQEATSVIHATAHAQADDIQVTSTGDAIATGERASAMVSVAGSVDPDAEIVAVGSATGRADAQVTEGGAVSAIANTDVEAIGDNLAISKEHETTVTDGNHPIVLSLTHLEAVQGAPAAGAPLEAPAGGADVAGMHFDFGSFSSDW